MVPPKTHPKWSQLLLGRFDYKFSNAPASMLLFQLKCDLRRDASPAAMSRAIDQMHAFCMKYERFVLSDLQTIFN